MGKSADAGPSTKQQPNSAWSRMINYFRWLYLQYLLVTALYMLEPWERAIFNVILIAVLAMCAYSTCVILIPSSAAYFSLVFGKTASADEL